MPYCLIFPGQGTQFPGMSKGLNLKWTGDDAILGLMENGPQDVLTRTINAQKAVFAVSAALWEASGFDGPAMVMGHSLGEYMALTASGAVPVEECLSLVGVRASAMEEAARESEGSMAAVLGMPVGAIQEALLAIDGVWVANMNTPGQVVISGRSSSIREASLVLKDRGAKRIVPLNVAVASHCPLMEPARKTLREYLRDVELKRPAVGMVFNAAAREESEPERMKDLLADGLVSPVQWEESVRYAVSKGIDRFIEIGPKSVLAPMVRKIVPDVKVEVVTNDH